MPEPSPSPAPDLSVLLPTRNEAGNLRALCAGLTELARELGVTHEIVVVDGGSRDGTAEVAAELGARVYQQRGPGYGAALAEGFEAVRGRYVVTMDADLSHSPHVLRDLYRRRLEADLVIASRYVRHGYAETAFARRVLSRVLNAVFRVVLDLPYRDLSSGYRLYRREALAQIVPRSRDFDVLIEILVELHNRGFRILEVPIHYRPRGYGESNARLAHFAVSYLRTLRAMHRLRARHDAADYEERGLLSLNPLRRLLHQRKHAFAMEHLERARRVLDLGTGSSRLLEGLPQSVGVDLAFAKLRYRGPLGRRLAQADARRLPFRDGAFDGVACVEILEHLEDDTGFLEEVVRVLAPGGVLVLVTPDRDTLFWRRLGSLYRRFEGRRAGDVHHRTLSRGELAARLAALGLELVAERPLVGVLHAVAARKPAGSSR